jgi:hypothetical protein
LEQKKLQDTAELSVFLSATTTETNEGKNQDPETLGVNHPKYGLYESAAKHAAIDAGQTDQGWQMERQSRRF